MHTFEFVTSVKCYEYIWWSSLASLFTTLYFLFEIRRARVIKNKNPGGFIDRQRKEVGVGEEENRRSIFFFLARSLRSRARQSFRKEQRT